MSAHRRTHMKTRGQEFDDLVIKAYMENHSAYKTGKRLGVSHKYVYRVLHARGVFVPGWKDEKPHRRAIPKDVEPHVLADYESGMSFKAMCTKYGCSDWAVRYLVKRSGSVRRPHGGQWRRFSTEDVAEMKRLVGDGWTQTAVAAKFNSTVISVNRALRSVGVVSKNKASGENHGSWKGGVTMTQHGYLQELVTPDHPMASMRTSTGYVLQHRLVMAEHLGRPIGRYETVHHINGNRKDNRIENLQLRQGKHGSGVVMKCRCCGSFDIEVTELG